MPSKAYNDRLQTVLLDADEINAGHADLRVGQRGRPYGLGALNRAVVVMCVSAWEAYVAEVVLECLDIIRPDSPPLGVWPAHNASVRALVGRFNNPNVQKTQDLIRNCIGLDDITDNWAWYQLSVQDVSKHLDEAISFRHRVVHGVTPRPSVHSQRYVSELPKFFRRLGRKTDAGITSYLSSEFGINTGW